MQQAIPTRHSWMAAYFELAKQNVKVLGVEMRERNSFFFLSIAVAVFVLFVYLSEYWLNSFSVCLLLYFFYLSICPNISIDEFR